MYEGHVDYFWGGGGSYNLFGIHIWSFLISLVNHSRAVLMDPTLVCKLFGKGHPVTSNNFKFQSILSWPIHVFLLKKFLLALCYIMG